MEKMTKAEWFNTLRGIVETSDFEDKDGAYEFIDRQIELIDSKAEKAKARAAAKKAEGDALRVAIETVLTDEYQTIAQITEAVDNGQLGEVTRNKVAARLAQLVKAGAAEKDYIKVDSHKYMAYRIPQAE